MSAAALLLVAAAAGAAPAPPATRELGRNPVAVPAEAPRSFVLLLSGGGDPGGDARLASALATRGALVATVDAGAWIAAHARSRCAYPAGDLEVLAQRVEKERGLGAYLRPFLVGRGDGAAVAWAALAQAPPGTFAGAVAIDPCPGRPLPLRLCDGSGPTPRRLRGGDLPALAPAPGPLEVVASRERPGCTAAAAEELARAIGARFTRARGAAPGEADGADGSGPAAALEDAVAAALERARAAPPPRASLEAVSDLPLVEVPAPPGDPRLAVLLSGDGGWVGIDKALAGAFRDAGVATVGLDSLRYFWRKRTPDETARDVARVITHYGAAWGRSEILLVGYSRGADIVPFVPARLGPELRARVRIVAMLGPSTFAEFEFHAIDLFSSVRRRDARSTEEAVRGSGGLTPMVCVQGSDEKDSLCPHVTDLPWVKRVVLRGGHHFDGDYAGLARIVLEAAGPR